MTSLDRTASGLAMLESPRSLTDGYGNRVFCLPSIKPQYFTRSAATGEGAYGPYLVKAAFQMARLGGSSYPIGDFVTR